MRALAVVLALPVAVASIAAQRPSPEPRELVARVLRAQSQLRYVGRRIVEFRNLGERHRRVEIVMRDGVRTRTEFAPDSPGAGQVIVEDRRDRRHFFPDTNEIHVSPPRHEFAIVRLREMMRSVRELGWKLTAREGETIAGIRTGMIEFADADGNVVQRLLVDPESGLVLRRELFDRVGTRVGFMQFETVDLKPRFRDDDFTITRRGARIVLVEELAERLGSRLRIRPVRLPSTSGFVLGEVRAVPLGPATALEQSFFGPGSALTVYQVRAEVNLRRLRMQVGSRVASRAWKHRDVTIAVVGEMPQRELDRLARMIWSAQHESSKVERRPPEP